MNSKLKYVFGGLCVASLVAGGAFATTSVPRSAVGMERARAINATSSPRAKQPVIMQRASASAPRSSRNVASRTASTPNRSTTSTLARAGNIITDAGDAIIRRALGISRSATRQKTSARAAVPSVARSAMPISASRSRATAVFSDISKLGEGYNNCRETYNTCMDQFCAGANETYRRCFCSNTFRTLRDKEDALDAATTMLAKFEDNNLNAVNKSAEEVNAMYSASAGEAAIKKDTSASAALLNDIGDLLAGRKKAVEPAKTSMTSLTGLSVDFSADMGDIWGSNNSNSLFNDNSGVDLSSLEGIELYTQAHNQCMQLVSGNCEAGAVKNMVKSAYGILITQDCNSYQKKLDQKTEQVKTTVRTAEKYLREARLEDYRSHNSADVNECMDKVENAITQPTACGADYVKCLDYSGVYINASTGEPIYSARLFGLNEIIQLDGSSDVLAQNPEFNQFLDSKRMYAASALDTCRSIADTVWSEFKRNALIKISQAQDEKIEEVKMSCVSTMKECYDTQSGALKSFDDTTAQASGALAARAAKSMCADKVLACAALYGDSSKCDVDHKTNKVKDLGGCGLTSLLNFVNAVDDTRIAEGCSAAVENYLKQLCTPSSGDEGYPWNCRLRKFGTLPNGSVWDKKDKPDSVVDLVVNYAIENCIGADEKKLSETKIQRDITQKVENLREELGSIMLQKCEEIKGIWAWESMTSAKLLQAFYKDVFGGKTSAETQSLGYCYENSTMTQCLGYNTDNEKDGDMARYDAARDECVFTDKWYEQQCALLGNGYFENGVCYVAQ